MSSILEHLKNIEDFDSFLLECYYMLCEFNTYKKSQKIKNSLLKGFLSSYPMDRSRQAFLRKSITWDLKTQVEFGDAVLKQLLKVFSDITSIAHGAASESDKRDLTILGRRIAA